MNTAANCISPAKPRKKNAFSLIELLIVMSVMGFLAAMSAPSLLTMRSASLSTAGGEFGRFLNLCRSKAIAERTSIRVGVVASSSDLDGSYKRYAAWEWDKRTSSYVMLTNWKSLPADSVFENRVPEYVAKSSYAEEEASTIEGDYVLTDGFQNTADEISVGGQSVKIQYLTYSPSGRASVRGGEKQNLIFVIRDSAQSEQENVTNWFQFTVDTLTGRAQIYRP